MYFMKLSRSDDQASFMWRSLISGSISDTYICQYLCSDWLPLRIQWVLSFHSGTHGVGTLPSFLHSWSRAIYSRLSFKCHGLVPTGWMSFSLPGSARLSIARQSARLSKYLKLIRWTASFHVRVQKTNIISNYLEYVNSESNSRLVWPREVWVKYADKLEVLLLRHMCFKALFLNESCMKPAFYAFMCLKTTA